MKGIRLVPMAIATMVLAACASIGRPEGGPRDEEPPRYVRSNPRPGELNVDRRTINILFDENVQLTDAFSKVVVSPVQKEPARVSANGRRVTVHINDTLQPNTTYTIDFADAIKDLNEGNILDGFALDFSTGDVLDTLRVSGIVLDASNLEPAQGMVVGAYANLEDSAIRTLEPVRVARTNQLGQFTLRNLAPGTYRIYAYNDMNRDWHWDRSEDVAFLDSLVVPEVAAISVTDTLYASDGGDSLVHRGGIQYLPNDLLLTWFNENHLSHYLKDYKRPERRRITINMSAPPDTLYQVRIVDGPRDTALHGLEADSWAVANYSARRDSLELWIADTAVLHTDSLRLSVRYLRTDTADRNVWQTDTLRFYYRDPKKSKKEMEADTLGPRYDLLQIKATSGSYQEVYLPLRLSVGQPLKSLDTAAVRFETLVDTLWTPVQSFALEPDSLNPVTAMIVRQKWTPGARYRLTVDSAAWVNIYDEHNKPFKHEFMVRQLEDYSNLTLSLTGADTTAIAQLLSNKDEVVMSAPVGPDGKAVFRFVKPGTYYARMFFDTDGNGQWTTGVLDSIQPEEVAYYPNKLDLKRNWDVEQSWDIYETPIDRQKPYAILKNRPKLKDGEKPPVQDTDEDEDPFADSWMNTGNSNTLRNRNNNLTNPRGTGTPININNTNRLR